MKISDVNNGFHVCKLIQELTQQDGQSVEIFHQNPDFGGPDCSVTWYADNMDLPGTQFFGA